MPDELDQIKQQLEQLRADMHATWNEIEPALRDLTPEQRRSSENLVHYLTLRRSDMRPLQRRLAEHGLSSLGRAECDVMRSVTAVSEVLRSLNANSPASDGALTFEEGQRLLQGRTDQLFRPPPDGRLVRIMVTLPAEAATDQALVNALVAGGMDCARINCAHDDEDVWRRMIENVRRAESGTGRRCRIEMDIAGPKLRTGQLPPGPRVTRMRPKRDAFGRLERPAYGWGINEKEAASSAPGGSLPVLPVPKKFFKKLTTGSEIRLTDTRGRRRSLVVEEIFDGHCLVRSLKTVYLQTGTQLTLIKPGRPTAAVGTLPPVDQYVLLRRGDTFFLTSDPDDTSTQKLAVNGKLREPARIPCTLPEVFGDLEAGENIWFDDGKIGGKIVSVAEGEIEVEITHAKIGGAKLRADKGINLPDSRLRLPSLTQKDLADLAFIVKHADIVGYSFVRTAADVTCLQERLAELGGSGLGVVLKIETRQAFNSLPDILLAAMRSRAAGVMIARGDLAIESGFERMAEVQEEMMWLCEAAHMPLIWATQVLEQLSKKGLPSRAEISDAAMSERTECVMLNKGPFVVDAVVALNDILTRMQAHQQKKRSMLRRLHLAEEFFSKERPGVSRTAAVA